VLGDGDLVAFVGSRDLAAAEAFYRDTLGLVLLASDSFAAVFDANGTTLRVSRVEEVAPALYTVLGWAVPDIAGAVEALAARGVAFERYEGMEQDEAGVWTAPDGTRVAWFADPDGNLLSLSESP
jgi:catechol 2,3-dioxygenase-like lactoylglutathione lyase family enzyme